VAERLITCCAFISVWTNIAGAMTLLCSLVDLIQHWPNPYIQQFLFGWALVGIGITFMTITRVLIWRVDRARDPR
jgi:hypothetical protein